MHVKSQQMNQECQFIGLEEILKPLTQPLELLNDFLNLQIELFEPELRDLVHYSLEHKGKRIRPMLLFYSAWRGSEISEELIKVAGIIELSHLATLVHDDILDEATIRHNTPTVCSNYGSKIAVLLGDALFSHALVLAAECKSKDVCLTIAQSIKRVCAGEIKQTFHSSKDTYTIDEYYRIVDLKTAELFFVSCFLGARLGGFSENYVNSVASFGRNIGIAYQIYDDLIDVLGSETHVGKTLGTDFASGKHTLPTLKLIEKLSRHDRIEFLESVRAGNVTSEYLKSMLMEYGVFSEVFSILIERIDHAGLAIADYKNLPSFPYLMKIQNLLLHQVKELERFAFS